MQWQWQRGRVLVYKDAVHVRMWRILRKRTPSSWRCPDRKSLFSLFLYPSQLLIGVPCRYSSQFFPTYN